MRTVLHTESSPGLGGQEIRTLNEARWIGERGWRVIVAGQPEGRFVTRAREAGLETAPVRMRSPWDLSAVARLTRLIRGEGVSVVHTHSSVDGWLGGLAARAARVPVVRTRHVSIPVRRGFNPVYTWLADRVITSGEAIRRIILRAGVPAGRVVAIPAGVDLETLPFRTAPFRAGASAIFRNLRLSSPVIGCVAMFRGSKGHAHLLEAFAAVRGVHPTATLLLVGDGIRRGWVEGLAREAGLAEHVVFTGFSDDVPALLAMMDCFVLASTRTEGVPQSLLQAFAAGVPVVASDIGGVPEVVSDGVTGLLAESGSAAALAAGIARVLADAPAAVRRAEAARALVEERFSHAASISRLLQLYGELLGAAAPTLRPAA
jgi:glycosyltransferase involved in cell wall biosynthesis